MNEDDRLLYDLSDEEYDSLSDEELAEISQRTMEDALEMMFPDGQDED
jgi:hypothetical protein